MGTIIGEISTEYKYSTADAANLGAAFIIGGILGCIPFGIWVGKYQHYKPALLVICFMAMTVLIIEYFTFPKGNIYWTLVICFFQGFVSIPISAVGFDLGVELTYPIGESFSTGLLMSSG